MIKINCLPFKQRLLVKLKFLNELCCVASILHEHFKIIIWKPCNQVSRNFSYCPFFHTFFFNVGGLKFMATYNRPKLLEVLWFLSSLIGFFRSFCFHILSLVKLLWYLLLLLLIFFIVYLLFN